MPRYKQKTSPRRIAARENQAKALNLRRAGCTFRQICDAVGYRSTNAAWHAVDRALMELVREPAEAVRRMELDRLDGLLRTFWPKAIAGEYPAADKVLQVMDRRARLLGLDAMPSVTAQAGAAIIFKIADAVPPPELEEQRTTNPLQITSDLSATIEHTTTYEPEAQEANQDGQQFGQQNDVIKAPDDPS